MSVSIRNRQSDHDPIARAHQRATLRRVMFASLGVVAVLGALGWMFLFSSLFAVTDIRVSGSASIGDERVRASVQELLDHRTLQLFQPARNIILLDPGAVTEYLMSNFAIIGQVAVEKEYPHTLGVSVTERVAFGLWCRDTLCQYFDRTGARWGEAVPSRGPLLVRVQDERSETDSTELLVKGMLAAYDGLPAIGLRGSVITLPDAAPGDVKISTNRKYDVLLDGYGDIEDQLATLGVLLSDKAKDAAWAPKYIDIRTPGRAYYR